MGIKDDIEPRFQDREPKLEDALERLDTPENADDVKRVDDSGMM